MTASLTVTRCSGAEIYMLHYGTVHGCIENPGSCPILSSSHVSLYSQLVAVGLDGPLRRWVECRQHFAHSPGSPCSECNDDGDWFFANLQRDCSFTLRNDPSGDGLNHAYVNVGARRGGVGTYWMSPLRLSYKQTPAQAQPVFADPDTPFGGFTCPCVRPQSDSVMGSFGNKERCVCGDFADQPADVEFELSVESTWNYALYNVVLCYLYMSPEHMFSIHSVRVGRDSGL